MKIKGLLNLYGEKIQFCFYQPLIFNLFFYHECKQRTIVVVTVSATLKPVGILLYHLTEVVMISSYLLCSSLLWKLW